MSVPAVLIIIWQAAVMVVVLAYMRERRLHRRADEEYRRLVRKRPPC